MDCKKTAPRERGAEKCGSRSARLVEVIEVRTCVGKGTQENPKRIVTEYWSKEGKLLAVSDPQYDE